MRETMYDVRRRYRTLGVGFLALVPALAALPACSDPGASQTSVEVDDGSLRGDLVAYVATFDDGSTETQYFLRRSDTDEFRLLFDVEPEVAPGSAIKVWGEPGRDGFNV